ncbi:MAG: MBL fold metallo-hydrolase [Deltaproteobacteria bacterium]
MKRGLLRLSVLACGSSGNACCVEGAGAGILIDAGLSAEELIRRMEKAGIDPAGLGAILLTHEHTDHIRGAGPLARRLDLPVYANRKTLKKAIKTLGNLSKPVVFQTGHPITLHSLCIETFTKCHDAADPVGLMVHADGVRLGIITDLGRSSPVVEDRLRGCHALVMEFNHDERMLEEGPYPLELKRRIKGPEGHLSNDQAGGLLKALCHRALSTVVLAHLSETNNHPEKAIQASKQALSGTGARVLVCEQACVLPMMDVGV